jgi:hypothetical protein
VSLSFFIVKMSADPWSTLVEQAHLSKGSVAFALTEKHKEDKVLKQLQDAVALTVQAPAPDYRGVMRTFSDSILPAYFLVVRGSTVTVLYGLKVCHEVAGPGRLLFLLGDRRRNLPPPLYRVTGNAGTQHQAFDNVQGSPKTAPDLIAWYDANDGAFAPPDTDAAAAAADVVTTVKALPIPPKWAGLFMPGLPMRRAVELGMSLVGTLPPADAPVGEVLIQWLRLAATTQANGDPIISSPWTLVELDEEAVLEWYDTLVGAFALTATAAPPSPTGVTAHPGFGTDHAAPTPGAATKRYLEMERHRIFKYCGVPGPWGGLTDESIPPFFKGLVDYRSKKASDVRFYVEGYAETPIAAHGRYCFIHSAQMINDLRYLNLDGGDKTYAYESRSKGFSIFAFAPFQDVGSSIRLRDEFLAHEAADQHYVGDKRYLAALNQSHAEWPGDRESTYRWVDHYTANVKRFLGDACPLIDPLHRILQVLNDPAQFTDWDMRDYWSMVWMLHKATRRFFLSSRPFDTPLIEEVARNLEATIPYNWQVLPREMRASPSPSPLLGTGEPSQKKATRPPRRAMFASTFRTEVDRARAAAKEAGGAFRISNLLSKDPDGVSLLGANFSRLAVGGRKPCIRYFVAGDCGHADTCYFCHELSGTPSKGMLDGIRERLKAAVDTYVKNPKV